MGADRDFRVLHKDFTHDTQEMNYDSGIRMKMSPFEGQRRKRSCRWRAAGERGAVWNLREEALAETDERVVSSACVL